jgi:hypothetical protein
VGHVCEKGQDRPCHAKACSKVSIPDEGDRDAYELSEVEAKSMKIRHLPAMYHEGLTRFRIILDGI